MWWQVTSVYSVLVVMGHQCSIAAIEHSACLCYWLCNGKSLDKKSCSWPHFGALQYIFDSCSWNLKFIFRYRKCKIFLQERACTSPLKHLQVDACISMFHSVYCLGQGNSVQHLSLRCHLCITSCASWNPSRYKVFVALYPFHTCRHQNNNSNLFE